MFLNGHGIFVVVSLKCILVCVLSTYTRINWVIEIHSQKELTKNLNISQDGLLSKILVDESIQDVQNVFQTLRKNFCSKELVVKATECALNFSYEVGSSHLPD